MNGDREHEGKKYDVIYGWPKGGGGWRTQAFRYPKETWTASQARSHCNSHDGSFEAASNGKGATLLGASQPWLNIYGIWAVHPEWFEVHARQVEKLAQPVDAEHMSALEIDADSMIDRMIVMGKDGLATIALHGPMIKHGGFLAWLFGFTSTYMITQAVQAAAENKDVSGIMLHVESPGGHVAGVYELAEAVKKARAKKPVFAHIEDIGASAAYWVSSQADVITANSTAEVGSLGTMAVAVDASRQADMLGLKVHVVSTGRFKGMGVPGSPIEDDHLEEIQRRVDAVNQFFMNHVKSGRKMSQEELNKVNDGRVFGAGEARTLGLIDHVRSFDGAMQNAASYIANNERTQSARRRIAETEGLLKVASHAPETQQQHVRP